MLKIWRRKSKSESELESRVEDLEIALGSIQGELAELRRMYQAILEGVMTEAVNRTVRRVRSTRMLDDIIEKHI